MHIQPLSLSITFANFIEVVAGMGTSLSFVLVFCWVFIAVPMGFSSCGAGV